MDNKYKLINFLGKNILTSFSMHDLSGRLKIPYASFYRTVKSMTDLIKIEEKGQARFISLNLGNPCVNSYLAVASHEYSKTRLDSMDLIGKIREELDTSDVVLLFGSYARGEQKEDSDIDIMVINRKGERSISFSKYELIFNKKINPIFVSSREFKLMLSKKDENVGKQVLKNHIVLNGYEKFWELVLNGI